ncbi:MAG: NFACT family protein [Muribaculaceae bacterium]|nr:NFACT family protein [Roseburia sp.]MCM1430398.1 NFACT family protein [Muribaculaceae bacterium]MCM1492406.1 NFACT family protein [Muribaculaceae bacterium]
MAFDGIVIAGLVAELQKNIQNTKISKIAQPEADELLLTLKGGTTQRLAISASASLPFLYLTEENKAGPLTAPAFCMLLRKHIANGRITGISQPHMERILQLGIEHLNEMGDLCQKRLIIELMGKHSNIIFCNEDGTIIDSIKRVSSAVSSLREVLPGRPYTIAATQQEKKNPLTLSAEEIDTLLAAQPSSVCKAVYGSLTGVSPLIANEIAHRAGIDGDISVSALSSGQRRHLANHIQWFFEAIKNKEFSPVIVRRDREPIEFSAVELTMYADCQIEKFDSISKVLEVYYAEKNMYSRIHQKSADLRRIVGTALERSYKKYDLQQKQLKDSEKREKYKIYGELINSFGYGLPENAKELEAENYYDDNRPIKIPLDPALTPQENARKYFDRYCKLKRTAEALTTLTAETKAQIDHLESVQNSLEIAQLPEDLVQIREELAEAGFIKKSRGGKKVKVKSRPFHYISSDGYDMYVGKNNFQNDELTFKFAAANDWWFHAKQMPGSHVIVKCKDGEMPDRVFEEAGQLAGFYSRGRDSEKVEIDYVQKKNVKKPSGAAPGFVVYYTNYSLSIRPDISALSLVE